MPDADPPGPGRSFREEDPGAAPPAHSRLERGEFRPEKLQNPPPRFSSTAFRVPPERLFEAAMEGLKDAGVFLKSVERDLLLASGAESLSGGLEAAVTASVQETSTGGGLLLLTYDRPPGTAFDVRIDEKRLQELLAKVDAALARVMGGSGPVNIPPSMR
jgi:hypothetical protein